MPYGRLAAWVMDHARATALVLALLVAIAGAIGLPPAIEPNLLALLPEDEPAAVALRELHDAEGGANLATLAFAAADPGALPPFLTALAADLEASELIRFAVHDVDPDLATRIGLLQIQPADVRTLSGRMRGALALGPALNPVVTQRLMDMGPVTERIEQATNPGMFPGAEPGDGRLLVRPTGSSHDPVFSLALVEEMERITEAALARTPGVTLRWSGGAYRHNVEDYRGIQQDVWWTTSTSLLLILGVIAFGFRSWRATLLVAIPLVAAGVLTLGFARLVLGSLNTYTSFGSAVLLGLGIDFAVHLVGRYREQRAAGEDVRQAVISAWDRVGPPCATAAWTSAAGFLALATADFQGFAQLGVLLAAGLLLALGTMLVVLPMLLPVLDRDPPLLRGARASAPPSRSTYAMAPGLLMVAVLATGFVGATRVPKLQWEYDVSALRRDGLAYAELSDDERALARESYSPVVLRYETQGDLRRHQARIDRKLDQEELPHVARSVSIGNVLPLDQAERLDALRELQRLVDHRNLRYLPPPLVEQLLPLKGLSLASLARDDLPAPLQSLLGADEGDHRLLLLPKGNMWDLREAAALEEEVRSVAGGRAAAGEYVALGALYRTMLRDIPIVGLLALVMVTLITAIDLRRPLWVAGAMGTLIAGLLWAGSALELFGVRLTMVNIVGVPILLGIGVDVVIHLLHRLKEEGPGGVRTALRTTGVAASLSTLTTVLSFCSLTMAGNRGVRSMGLLVVIGLLAVFVTSALILPTAWAAGWKVSGRAPGDRDP